MEGNPTNLLLRITGGLIALLGLMLGGGGVWLVALGGSIYYLLAGLALLACGALLMRGQPVALWVHAALVAGTLAWALWEAGLDWWPLAARLDVLFIIGLVLLSPWVRRALRRDQPRLRGPIAGLAAVLGIFVVVALASWFVDPHRLDGALPPPRAETVADRAEVAPGEWWAYGRTGHGQRYSPLTQITPENVKQLDVAWTYRTGDLRGRPGDPVETTFEVTPLKVGNRLFLCTPHQSVIALDATTGEQLWRHDPKLPADLALQHLTCRGLSYHPPSALVPAAGACQAKLFMPTADGRIIALDPQDGRPCRDYGGGRGHIDLWAGMPPARPGSYYSTSPVVVTRQWLIVGGTVLDNVSTREASGVIRAYDAESGTLAWAWDPGRPDRTTPLAPGETYTASSPNSWSIASVDEKLGLVFVPMGNQPPDQWGAERSEAVDRFSSSVVALDLASGRLRWRFQTVHHDLWDYDVPSQPSLVDLAVEGRIVPALVQPTKQGDLYVLDRRTGEPVVPVRELPAPGGAAQGDRAAATQPASALSFNPPPLRGRDMWGATMFDQLACRIAFHRLRYEGRFTPPSTQGSLVYPGNFGVFNWGGVAIDPQRQVVFATPTYLAFVSRLVPRPDDRSLVVQGDNRPPQSLPALNENFGAPYAVQLKPFTSALGLPCQEPPWGFVAGADLASARVVWQRRNGTVRDITPIPWPFEMGVPNLGGPIVTGGGLAFLSGTLDYYLRAYDLESGRELWRSRLPAGAQATPMTYTGQDGRQFVVVAAGGHGSLGTRAGDHVIAYALPKG